GLGAEAADLRLDHHELEAAGRLVLVAPREGGEFGHRGERIVPRLRAGQLHPDRRGAFARDPRDADALAFERLLDVFRRTVGLAGDVLVRLHAHHEVSAAWKMEAEVESAPRWVQLPDGDGNNEEDERDPPREAPRHPSRPAPPRRGQWRSGRIRA